MKNNIFDFATSELSQDAFICWCVNWFNDDSKPELKDMAINLLKRLSGAEKIEQVKIFRQFSEKVTLEEKGVSTEIKLKIDVLLIVNGSIAVIIEDKTYTGEHDDQIARYERGLRHLSANTKEYEDFAGVEQVRTVYLKTGFIYDDDKLVKADLVIGGESFLGLLSPYEGNSEILDSYVAHLRELLEWYSVHGRYAELDRANGKWNVSQHQIAQYRLMREIFPEETWWTDRDPGKWNYRVYHGSNRDGSPWTQMCICDSAYRGTNDKYHVFWRIDTDNKGPYISLRFYEGFNKGDKAKKERHKDLYNVMSRTVREIVEQHCDLFYFGWEDVNPGYCGNYKEPSLIHLAIMDKLKNWSAEKESVIRSVLELTRFFDEQAKQINM